MAHMPDIFGGLVRDWDHAERAVAAHLPRRHAAPQTPAPAPATMTAATAAVSTQEDPMSITAIANDIKGALENADEWARQVTETHLPAILAAAQKYEASPIVQALEGALLPPEVEQRIAGLIGDLAKTYPAQTAAPAAPAQPQQAAVAAGQ